MEQLFYDIFEKLPRLGPGNNESTEKALKTITSTKGVTSNLNILDIGCGTGIHTTHLAKLITGKITAMDRHQPFLNKLQSRLETESVSETIDCVLGDMSAMDFEKESFDVIWAEGSIFIIGVETGLNLWKKFLRPGGFLAFSDLFWLKPNPPEELVAFFEQQCAGLLSREEALTVIDKAGYSCIDQFVLPESVWWDSYYCHLDEQLKIFRKKYTGQPEAFVTIDHLQTEIDLYRKYSEYYGYIFFILKKTK